MPETPSPFFPLLTRDHLQLRFLRARKWDVAQSKEMYVTTTTTNTPASMH